jgi:hypothetical protein
MTQDGGVVLNSSLYTRGDNHGIKPLYDILGLDGTRVSLLTASSLNGIMFKIDIDADDTVSYPYLDLLPGSQRFSVDVKSFIVKIVVVSTQERDKLGPLVFGNLNIVGDQTIMRKESVSPENFKKEAIIQDSIWIQSVSGSRPAICPSVAYASILNDDVSDRLLATLNNKLDPRDIYAKITIAYLAETIYNKRAKVYYAHRKLGILLMPTIPDARTFYQFRHDHPVDPTTPEIIPEVIRDVVANIIAQIVRTCIELKVIHLDLHSQNVMVYPDGDIMKSKIIDFGRASILDSGSTDSYFSEKEKAEILEEIADMYTEVSEINLAQNDKEKIDFMRETMEYITDLEKHAYQKAHPDREPGHYQLQWIKKYIDYDDIMLSAFNKLPSMMLVNIDRGVGISYSTINRKHPHRLDFPRELIRRREESDDSSEPNTKRKRGGKSKKSKKYKTTKKSKKYKMTKNDQKSPKSPRKLKHYKPLIIPIIR